MISAARMDRAQNRPIMSRSASCASQTRSVMRRESRTTVASRRHGVCGSALERSASSRERRAYATAAPASRRGLQAAWLVPGWRYIRAVGTPCRILAAESSWALHRRARESVDRPWRLVASLRSLGTGEDRLPLIASSNHFTVVIVAGGGHHGGWKMVHRPWGNRPILRRGLVGSNARALTPGWRPKRERGGASDAPMRQSDLRREGRRFATAAHAALVQDVAHVAARRRRRNHETLADFPAGQPLRDQRHDLAFARRQAARPLRRIARAHRAEAARQRMHLRWIEQRLAASDVTACVENRLRARVPDQEARCAPQKRREAGLAPRNDVSISTDVSRSALLIFRHAATPSVGPAIPMSITTTSGTAARAT